MAKTHYETLGVEPSASQADIRSAYRKLVLMHHPDRSKSPRSVEIFREATDAYDVIGDPDKRKTYDDTLKRIAQLKAEQEQKARDGARSANFGAPQAARATPEVQRLASLFARGRMAEAEALAREIRQADPRQPMPYAVLGDIARSRGRINEAQKMYAYAAQFDPTNAVYQRKYEQLLEAAVVVTGVGSRVTLEAREESPAAPLVGAGLVLVGAGFVAFSGESSVFGPLSLISSWTVGLLFALFFAGIAVGSSLAVGNFLDRFTSMASNAVGKVGPAVILGAVALVNFWAALALYLVLGVAQRAFNYSTTRLVLGVCAAVLLFTLAAALSHSLRPGQVFLWGGNVAYLGALVGWMVSDAFRA